jgi:hypothetical protein
VSLAGLLIHDVDILTAPDDTNRYGGSDRDWSAASSVTVKGWISQRSTTEDFDGRDAQIDQWILFLHPDDTITAENRVSWSGITFEVDGRPNPAWTPRGLHHQEVPLRVVAG